MGYGNGERTLRIIKKAEVKDIILCAIQDVTETYIKEEKQRRELAVALEAAEAANRSKSEFLSRMSHDMRTPMNAILGLAELSEPETEVTELKSNIAQMKESGRYLLGLINDTLDLQRIESGKMCLNNEIVHTTTVFESIVEMIRQSAEAKGVEFKVVNRNADMNWYVYTDPVRIKQIFINLLSNAVKFTPKGGIVRFEVQMLSREGMISHNCIKVIDNGIGMSEKFLKDGLFKPFSQEHNEVSTQYAGSGLGLSISKSLIEMMGGHIEVESTPDIGTTFSVYLDFLRINEHDAKETLIEKKSQSFVLAEELLGKNILLVEDHPLNAQIATRILKRAGCRIHWEDNGKKAVEEFERSENYEYDAVLMDIRMPIMDGLEATSAIRALEREDAKTTPIIAMTANAYDSDIRKSLGAGMNAHLSKPIVPEQLYEALVSFINHGVRVYEISPEENSSTSISALQNMIKSMHNEKGALQVEFDVFNKVYSFIQRNIKRTNQPAQILLFSLQSENADIEPSGSRSALSSAIRNMLRYGDLMMNFGSAQIAVLLINCDKENAEAGKGAHNERIRKAGRKNGGKANMRISKR